MKECGISKRTMDYEIKEKMSAIVRVRNCSRAGGYEIAH